MKTLTRILAATACAVPLVATAQTGASGVQPADQPRTNLEKQQTTQNGQATKYGSPGTDTGGAATTSQPGTSTSTGSDAGSTTMKHKHRAKSTAAKPGETPSTDGTGGTAGGTTPK